MLRQRGNESRGHKWRRTRKPKIAVLTAGKGVGTAIFLLCHHACSIVSARFVPRIVQCDCEKTYSDPDATCGVQRTKANQNKFFIGYRKHSIVCPSPKGPLVLFSIILPNDTADVKVMLPLIDMMKKIEGLQVDYVVADLGYLDAKDQKVALLCHDVAVVTGIKKTTVIPEHCSSKGNPECEQGHALVFNGFTEIPIPSGFVVTLCCALPVLCKVFAINSLADDSARQGDCLAAESCREHQKAGGDTSGADVVAVGGVTFTNIHQ